MGFGESASHIIFFIAAVMVASSAATVMSITTYKISLNLAEESKHLREVISTDFKIINDPVNIPTESVGSEKYYVFYVKNIGIESFPFTKNTLTVLIDGKVVQFEVNPNGELKSGEVGKILVKFSEVGYGNHKMKIVLHNGISDSFEFTI